jgi:hypothetical protein
MTGQRRSQIFVHQDVIKAIANGVWTLVRDTTESIADSTIIAAANPIPAN